MFTIEKNDIENMQNKIKLVRQTLGIGLVDFANLLGVSRQTIYNIENYKSNLTQTQYLAMKTIIDLSLNEQPEKKKIIDVILTADYNPNNIER